MARTRVPETPRWLAALPFGILGALVGYAFGAAGAALSSSQGGTPPENVPTMVAMVMGATSYLLYAWLVRGSADAARRVFMGADQGTAPEYSAASAHEIRGQFQLALDAYAAGAAEYPEDPEPLVRGARILRERLGRPEEALEWLRRARAIPGLGAAQDILVDRELVRLHEATGQPHLALPILARMAERHAGTRPGEEAGRKLARLRTQLWQNVRDDPADELSAYQKQVLGTGDPAEDGKAKQ